MVVEAAPMQTYTFMCLDNRGVATAIDIADMAEADYRRHARILLQSHLSARSIEVWTDTALIDVVERYANPARDCGEQARPS